MDKHTSCFGSYQITSATCSLFCKYSNKCANKSKQLAIMCGMPLSGKSTYANLLQKEGWIVVCPDNIRLALHGQQFVLSAEPFITGITHITVKALIDRNQAVLVDATNLTHEKRLVWRNIAKEFSIPLKIILMDTPSEECVSRNERTTRHSPSLLEDMQLSFETLSPVEGPVYFISTDDVTSGHIPEGLKLNK